MNDRLDEALRALRAEPDAPADLDQLECGVWRSIEGVRKAQAAAPTIAAVRTVAVACALGLGIVSGGATAVSLASQPQEVSAFSLKAELAPSTLLDHGE